MIEDMKDRNMKWEHKEDGLTTEKRERAVCEMGNEECYGESGGEGEKEQTWCR